MFVEGLFGADMHSFFDRMMDLWAIVIDSKNNKKYAISHNKSERPGIYFIFRKEK